jgi:hypothetical protein
MPSFTEAVSAAGLAGVLLLSPAAGSQSSVPAPEPSIESDSRGAQVGDSAKAANRGVGPTAIRGKVSDPNVTNGVAGVSVSGTVDRKQSDRREARIDLYLEHPGVAGGSEEKAYVYAEVPCFPSAPAVCDWIDRIDP